MSERFTVTSRRSFLTAASGIGACGLTQGCGLFRAAFKAGEDHFADVTLQDDDPIAATEDGPEARSFFGDEPTAAHTLLWTKPQVIAERGGLPKTGEKASVVIVGGGIAGLSAAWLLRDLNPVLLEGASRFGGNAKGHRWGDLTYGIGSAYFTHDTRDSPQMRMLRDLGLRHMWREDDPTHDQMHVGGIVHPEFWFGGTDPARKADFRAAWNYFKEVREERYPDIPLEEDSDLDAAEFEALDRRSFADELKLNLGAKLHPHVEDVVHEYCWSAFGADAREVSAAAGLNFLASDLGGILVLPGSNAAITQALVTRLRRELPDGSLRSGAMVLDVKLEGDGVRVTFIDREGKLKSLEARACIVSSPKFVARRLIDELPNAQREAMSKLTYRAYVVASVLIDQPRAPDFHDLYCISGAAPKPEALREEVERRAFTDVTLATFARRGHPSKTVLNLFHALPYDGARAQLLAPNAYDESRGKMEAVIPGVVRVLGLDPARVRDVRMTRWGHALVFPRPGMLSDGVLAASAAPYGGKVFFAQQDNWAMPSFETAFGTALEAAKAVRGVLKS